MSIQKDHIILIISDISDTHSYSHNWSLQPFNQDYGLASHTTYVVCITFIRECRDLQLNVNSERQLFEKLFNGNILFLLSEFLTQICWEEIAEEMFFFFTLHFYAWLGLRIRALLPTRLWRMHQLNNLLIYIYTLSTESG